jgi:hypothetical protein
MGQVGLGYGRDHVAGERIAHLAGQYATVVMVAGALITGFTVLSAAAGCRLRTVRGVPERLRSRTSWSRSNCGRTRPRLTHTPNCRRGARLCRKGCVSALANARTIRSIVPAERGRRQNAGLVFPKPAVITRPRTCLGNGQCRPAPTSEMAPRFPPRSDKRWERLRVSVPRDEAFLVQISRMAASTMSAATH